MKRAKRTKETNQLLEDAVAEQAKQKALESRADDDLFQIDRTGSKNAKRRIVKAKAHESQGTTVSLVERRLIAKKMAELEKKKKNDSSSDGQNSTQAASKANALMDLWSDEGMVVPRVPSIPNRVNPEDLIDADVNNKKRRARAPLSVTHEKEIKEQNKTKKVKPAIPGQSYNPSHESHQDALAEALALTLKKQREDELKARPVVDRKELSELTKAFTSNESDSDDSDNSDNDDDEDDDDDDSDGSGDDDDDDDGVDANGKKYSKLPRRAREKKTRAQRNKERTKKMRLLEQKRANMEKKMLKSLDNVPELIKRIDKEEEAKQAQKNLSKMLLQNAQDDSMLTYAEAGAVPLSDELRGSLRQVKPKGNVLVSQVAKMRETGDLMARDRRKRRAYEKPHRGERVVWIPKYKY